MWQHIQKMKQHFWTRWHREYLNELTTRTKWTSGQHSIKESTLVLIKEDYVPSMQWPFGRIIQVRWSDSDNNNQNGEGYI